MFATGVRSAMVELDRTDRMAFWVGQVARRYRESAGVKRSQIAGAMAIDQSTVTRFETSGRFSSNIDEILLTYAELTGVEDPRDIWAAAVASWPSEGSLTAPATGEEPGGDPGEIPELDELGHEPPAEEPGDEAAG